MELIENVHLQGLIIGAFTFIIIGLFHPLVVKAEYYWGTKSWLFFLCGGIISGTLSIIVSNLLFSILLGVLSFSSFWSILEIFEQEKRVKRGWFPKNPNRK